MHFTAMSRNLERMRAALGRVAAAGDVDHGRRMAEAARSQRVNRRIGLGQAHLERVELVVEVLVVGQIGEHEPAAVALLVGGQGGHHQGRATQVHEGFLPVGSRRLGREVLVVDLRRARCRACVAGDLDRPVVTDVDDDDVLVGADDELFAEVEPIVSCFADNIYRCGGVGAGHIIKLANNTAFQAALTILAEGFSVCVKSGVDPAKLIEAFRSAIPLGRLGSPAEAARAIFYLATPLSSYTTGSHIDVSGGLSRYA